MIFQKYALMMLALAAPSAAFTTQKTAFTKTALASSLAGTSMEADIRREIQYKPGAADTEFARRFGGKVGAQIKTVGEAFAAFNNELGYTVNPLYKNMVTDLVGTTHLILVNARFQRDPIWSLGIVTALDLLLKNYPEPGMGDKIVSALFKSVGLDESTIRKEANQMLDWVKGKSREEVEAALSGEGSSPLAGIANSAKADKFWMYSRYFGIGLVKFMEEVGIEMDKDTVYPIMENWMSGKLGKSHLTACSDSDLFFRIREKLDMMETMMKEIEIREKKRMAERLEARAEAALKAAERDAEFEKEVEAEKAGKA